MMEGLIYVAFLLLGLFVGVLLGAYTMARVNVGIRKAGR